MPSFLLSQHKLFAHRDSQNILPLRSWYWRPLGSPTIIRGEEKFMFYFLIDAFTVEAAPIWKEVQVTEPRESFRHQNNEFDTKKNTIASMDPRSNNYKTIPTKQFRSEKKPEGLIWASSRLTARIVIVIRRTGAAQERRSRPWGRRNRNFRFEVIGPERHNLCLAGGGSQRWRWAMPVGSTTEIPVRSGGSVPNRDNGPMLKESLGGSELPGRHLLGVFSTAERVVGYSLGPLSDDWNMVYKPLLFFWVHSRARWRSFYLILIVVDNGAHRAWIS